jgi:formamidopyrimidine-DNA glycosylase
MARAARYGPVRVGRSRVAGAVKKMPELPEVEIVRQGLEPVLTRARFTHVEQRRANLRFDFPERFAKRLAGQSVERLERRAKYLVAHLSSDEVLLMHLGMTGRFTVRCKPRKEKLRGRPIGDFAYNTGANSKHDHIVFHMDHGAVVTYNDPRRFGFMLLVPQAEFAEHPLIRGLGVEPLGPALTAEYLAQRAARKAVDLKAFLSDQRIVAGLGNIYVCEALFRAGLSPKRPAASLATKRGMPTARALELIDCVRTVLKDSITAGGSSLRDYRHADGAIGAFQEAFAVYGRQGAPCLAKGCGGSVRRIVQGGRSSFYCPNCQR